VTYQNGIHLLDARGPEGLRLYAIGDVHGRLDLLSALHERIAGEIAQDQPDDWRIIHLGDYCDRGPDTRGTIEFLIRRMGEDDRILALAGNHDIGFLDFLGDADRDSLFVRFGGVQTAQSYGVSLDASTPATLRHGQLELGQALPTSHLEFLGDLKRSVAFGDYFFCHAGIRPGVPLDRQDEDDLVWIRRDFLDYPGLHPKIIVHGHTITPVAELMPNRVNIDTGAYHTGELTAFVVEGSTRRLLSVVGSGR